MHHFIRAHLFILALGLFNSVSLMALSHILITPPVIFSLIKLNTFRKLPKSAWAMLFFCLSLILSILFNQENIASGYKYISNTKYYLIGVLSIVPIHWYFNEYLNPKEREKFIKKLLWIFLISTSLAIISGLIGFFTGFNPLKFKHVQTIRNSGMFGMLITYAHQSALLGIILISISLNTEQIKKYIPKWPLFLTLFLTLIGLFLSYTRGAILALIGGIFFINRKIALIALSFLLIGTSILIYFNPAFIKGHILRKSSNEQRISFWQASLDAFKERPLFGYGFKNFEPHSSKLKKKYGHTYPERKGHAHNNLLEILATTGIFGFLAFSSWMILWFLELKSMNSAFSKPCILFLIVFFLGGLTQATFIDGENLFFIFLVYPLSFLGKKLIR